MGPSVLPQSLARFGSFLLALCSLRLGFFVVLQSSACLGSPPSALFASHLGTSLPPKRMHRPGAPVVAAGIAWMGLPTPVLDPLYLGSPLPLRSLAHVEAASPAGSPASSCLF
ncbi:unnamed protein product [Symbiodinium necroappetens]|uniref:Uncharacterized protein n=1 Tax=Symbiodinium necroappetens TaxID=1628268 RepID=A0A812LS14_9DINO|nr:unnamed protein product [Symbiodinium necroappetens]